jgi:hypothetical protein
MQNIAPRFLRLLAALLTAGFTGGQNHPAHPGKAAVRAEPQPGRQAWTCRMFCFNLKTEVARCVDFFRQTPAASASTR